MKGLVNSYDFGFHAGRLNSGNYDAAIITSNPNKFPFRKVERKTHTRYAKIEREIKQIRSSEKKEEAFQQIMRADISSKHDLDEVKVSVPKKREYPTLSREQVRRAMANGCTQVRNGTPEVFIMSAEGVIVGKYVDEAKIYNRWDTRCRGFYGNKRK